MPTLCHTRVDLCVAAWRLLKLPSAPAGAFVCCAILAWLSMAGLASADDVIEFLSGIRTNGKVVEIRKQQRKIEFEVTISNQTFRRTYPYDQVHAVTYQGKRYVLNPMPADGDSRTPKPTQRTQAEVRALIESEGSTPPEWYDSTPLDYPRTLDLSWPEPPQGPWDNQKNVGQYVWDIINPNPNRWRSGIRLMHFLLAEHKDDAKLSRRIMASLGGMYFRFFQDYPRAAFWWQKAKVTPQSMDGVGLAECYWRLGNRQMALKLISGKTFRLETIKLLGDMGQTDRAVKLAEDYAQRSKQPHWAWLAAADACRIKGDYRKAIAFYQRVLDAAELSNPDYDHRLKRRAEQSIEAIKLFDLLDIRRIPDGTYVDSSVGYEGLVQVTVTVQDGRIQDVEVSDHQEKQFYSALRDMPQQIIAKQSVKDVDATSRATITAEAIVSATAKALQKAGTKTP
jgi:uncharacterized protein with FMN-binding domain